MSTEKRSHCRRDRCRRVALNGLWASVLGVDEGLWTGSHRFFRHDSDETMLDVSVIATEIDKDKSLCLDQRP